jgi:hypothetical protein
MGSNACTNDVKRGFTGSADATRATPPGMTSLRANSPDMKQTGSTMRLAMALAALALGAIAASAKATQQADAMPMIRVSTNPGRVLQGKTSSRSGRSTVRSRSHGVGHGLTPFRDCTEAATISSCSRSKSPCAQAGKTQHGQPVHEGPTAVGKLGGIRPRVAYLTRRNRLRYCVTKAVERPRAARELLPGPG